MNEWDDLCRRRAAEEKIEMPENVKKRLEETLAALPEKEKVSKRPIHIWPRLAAVAACLVFLAVFVMPNVSVVYAQALEKVPVLGNIIRVVTIRNYFYEDPFHSMDIKVPEIDNPDGLDGVDAINKEVEQLSKQLMEQFYADMGDIGDSGHGSTYVDYTVLTNTDKWFTLKLSVHIIAGSGSSSYHYYHINKETGAIVKLSDLFNTPDFSPILTENIKKQMVARMEEQEGVVYWVDDAGVGLEFAYVEGNHNFYFDEQGNLVIPFDKYEVAPGSMGCPEFTIKKADIASILKEEYR